MNAVIDRVQSEPYKLGESDCLTMVCQVISAMTGVDYWPRFSGYKTKRQALVTIASIAPSFAEAVTSVLGERPIRISAGRRGDIAMYRDIVGEDHLGVIVGNHISLRFPDGARLVRCSDQGVLCAWRIG